MSLWALQKQLSSLPSFCKPPLKGKKKLPVILCWLTVRYVSCHITIKGQLRRKFCSSDPKCITWPRRGLFFCFMTAKRQNGLSLTSPWAQGELEEHCGSMLLVCTTCKVMESAPTQSDYLGSTGIRSLLLGQLSWLSSQAGNSYISVINFENTFISWVCPSLLFRLQVPGSRSCFLFWTIFSDVISHSYFIKKRWVLINLHLI